MYKRLPDDMTILGLPRLCIIWGRHWGSLGFTIIVGRYIVTTLFGKIPENEEDMSYGD